jgi:periplasmic copper chaperone A
MRLGGNMILSVDNNMAIRSFFIFCFMLVTSLCANAGDTPGKVYIEHAYARATVPGQSNGAAYLTIINNGTGIEHLVDIHTTIARGVEIHTMSIEGNVMKMREAPSFLLPPSTRIIMKPGGGYHVMLLGLHTPLKSGDRFSLVLRFEHAGKIDVPVVVE